MKGIIYLLSNSVDDKIYVGSTIRRLSQRFGEHRSDARAGVGSKLYKHMREVGISKWMINSLKVKEVADRKQLEKLEYKYIQLYHQSLLLNTDIVYGKKAEFSDTHRKNISIARRCEKSSRFHRGTIGVYKVYSIMFRWQHWENNKRISKSKSFSMKKYGEKEAWEMIKEYQNKIYPITE